MCAVGGWALRPATILLVTALIAPFTGYVPASEFAHRIARPPRSMLSDDQIRAASVDPLSFRHVAGRGAGISHTEAHEWLQSSEAAGVLHATGPAVFVHRTAGADLVATGLIADISIDAYRAGRVKRHELTLDKTETKMADYMRTSRICGNPVSLAHRPHAATAAAIAAHTARDPDYRFDTADGFSHALWKIEGDDAQELCAGFDEDLYIVDGHHRLAAASRVAAEEGQADPRIPAGLVSADELHVRSFARCVVDDEVEPGSVIDRLASEHDLEAVTEDQTRPRERLEFGVKIGARNYRLRLDPGVVPTDAYTALDVNLLQDLILGPVFGITDPSQDRRLRFVADTFGEDHRDLGCSAWFLPFPVSVADVMATADAGHTMPPKSTWFAPKLPSGLVIRPLDRVYVLRPAANVDRV